MQILVGLKLNEHAFKLSFFFCESSSEFIPSLTVMMLSAFCFLCEAFYQISRYNLTTIYKMPWLIWRMQSIFMKNAVKNKVWLHVVLFGHTHCTMFDRIYGWYFDIMVRIQYFTCCYCMIRKLPPLKIRLGTRSYVTMFSRTFWFSILNLQFFQLE